MGTASGWSPSLINDGESALRSPEQQADDILQSLHGRRLMVLLDYDGTLSPIAPRPEDAVLPPAMRIVLDELSGRWNTAVISGRALADVRDMVGVDGIVYAGNHGLEIEGPAGTGISRSLGEAYVQDVAEASAELQSELESVEGSLVEDKQFSLSVHYRLVASADVRRVEAAVDTAIKRHPRLRKRHGKKVFELRPDLDWDKGRAVTWLLEVVNQRETEALPIYIGDDDTDEDAFRALENAGIGVLVSEEDRPTAATHRLSDTDGVRRFLARLAEGEVA